ncbi:hypothetical protein I4200191B4_10340 [Pseudoflavonifractor gallinarum]
MRIPHSPAAVMEEQTRTQVTGPFGLGRRGRAMRPESEDLPQTAPAMPANHTATDDRRCVSREEAVELKSRYRVSPGAGPVPLGRDL